MFRRLLPLKLALLLLCACESGTSRSVDVTIGAALEAQFSPESRGLLVADLGGTARPYAALCGQGLRSPLALSQDLGFGCLRDRNGTEETIRVWVEPTGAGPFDCSTQRSFYVPDGVVASDPGAKFAAEPAAGWAQATASGTWRRDLSPCGGVLEASVTLDAP